MTEQEFDKVVEDRLETIKQTILIKGKEYRREGNPFHNFDKAGEMFNIHPIKALEGMRAKHDVSIQDIFNDVANGKVVDPTVFTEKLGDRIVYDIIAEAMFFDNFNN